ncbi:MAG: RNA polymerase sigma factor [Gemmatimonadales bacterium]|jgi:RNA polymerase sigma-70 factor (ECF subfamily)
MAARVLENVFNESLFTFGANTASEPRLTARDELQGPPVWDEDDLVRRAQAGQSDAFERLYEIHVRRMYGLCLRMVSDHQRAEELTQDIFVRAWERVGSFKFRSAFGTWLHRLGTNVVLGNLRSEKGAEKATAPNELDAFEHGLRQAMPETRMDLERAIALLPPGAKEVLILHDIEGYRYREIAEMVDIAEGTVKSQLSRARRLVREALLK